MTLIEHRINNIYNVLMWRGQNTGHQTPSDTPIPSTDELLISIGRHPPVPRASDPPRAHIKMKARFHILLLSWIFTLVVAERISYDGYKAFRVATGKNIKQITDQLSSFGSVSLGCEEGHSDHLDIAIPPQSISDFEALGLQATAISDDLGADFAIEGAFEPYISST